MMLGLGEEACSRLERKPAETEVNISLTETVFGGILFMP